MNFRHLFYVSLFSLALLFPLFTSSLSEQDYFEHEAELQIALSEYFSEQWSRIVDAITRPVEKFPVDLETKAFLKNLLVTLLFFFVSITLSYLVGLLIGKSAVSFIRHKFKTAVRKSMETTSKGLSHETYSLFEPLRQIFIQQFKDHDFGRALSVNEILMNGGELFEVFQKLTCDGETREIISRYEEFFTGQNIDKRHSTILACYALCFNESEDIKFEKGVPYRHVVGRAKENVYISNTILNMTDLIFV
ncbi:MAG: hypothetical protein NZT61_05205 [Deltaproteobacteria bacterium]|nr:hypothetical protein [Deltaproteobacteria bacterium]MCX7952725.1 hypothetical protein [Deltaproteobacteria bacterium]